MPETLPIPPCRVLIRTPLSDSCFRKYYNRSCEKSRKDVLSSFDDCSEENSGDSSEEVKIVERRLSVDRWEINFIQLSCGLQEQCSVWRRFEHHKGRLPPRRLQRLLSFRGRLWIIYHSRWCPCDSGDKKRSKLAALRLWYPLLLEALPGYFFLPLDALCPQGLSDLRSRGLGCQEALSARKFQA
nr:uncharacterized protein LOC103403491 [Malus domestica]